MPTVTLPDGSQRSYPNPLSIHAIASDIGPGLAKSAIAARLNGDLVDISTPISTDASISIITARDPEAVDIIRHSCAHLMAQAVKQLYPTAQVTIGPTIENGYYYDFAFERAFTPEDLEAIEQCMLTLARENQAVTRSTLPRDEAIALFKGMGERYKAEIIADIPKGEALSLYRQGDFIDLCRGPHVPSTGHIKAFKLMKVAGAYWRGNADNEVLQRIYGTAWPDKKQLKQYLHRLAEAEKRDHRKLGKQLDLFHLQDEAPGMVFWHPNGWKIYQTIEQHMRIKLRDQQYQEIKTPQILAFTLWERSGHADKFGDDMFSLQADDKAYAVKPMNCPCHVQVFNQGLKSYRELPLRLAEFGSCHRNELSGALHGLMRVRGFVQDDGHIFCTEDQIQSEVISFIHFLHEIYLDFGFTKVIYRLSTRPEKRVGTDADWDRAEQALAQALDHMDLEWELLPGEGAFYGPKIEFSLQDCIGRTWQCGTMQVDFSMPGRLGASYVAEDGSKRVPVMLHRAILGSFERFIGILIEQYDGKLPTWLAPCQVMVLTITDKQNPGAERIAKRLQNAGVRAQADLRNEKIGFKIRDCTLKRVPYMLVVGERELASDSISVRSLDGVDLGNMMVEDFTVKIVDEIDSLGKNNVKSNLASNLED